jgi:membrane-associated phospholipid phosphatase
MTLSGTLRSNRCFLIPYLILLCVISTLLLLYSKAEIHLWINQFHTPFFDWFFRIITFMGDGLFVIIVVVILLFFSFRHSVYLLSAYLSTGLFVQILKRLFFQDVVRPSKYFSDQVSLHLVEGLKMLGSRSFPSGHSASSFALFIGFALISQNRFVKIVSFIMACLVAFSRVYLSQHFLIDIYAGSLIGCAGAIYFYTVFYNKNHPWYAYSLRKFI